MAYRDSSSLCCRNQDREHEDGLQGGEEPETRRHGVAGESVAEGDNRLIRYSQSRTGLKYPPANLSGTDR